MLAKKPQLKQTNLVSQIVLEPSTAATQSATKDPTDSGPSETAAATPSVTEVPSDTEPPGTAAADPSVVEVPSDTVPSEIAAADVPPDAGNDDKTLAERITEAEQTPVALVHSEGASCWQEKLGATEG